VHGRAGHGCFDAFNGVVLMAVVALPLAALVASARARRRLAAGAVPAALASRRWWRTKPESLSDRPQLAG
jgi:hypothetical protein